MKKQLLLFALSISMFNTYSESSSLETYRKIVNKAFDIGKLEIKHNSGTLISFNSRAEIVDEFTPRKEERYQEALKLFNQQNHDEKIAYHSLSQQEVLELLEKIAAFKKEFEEPISWKEFLNPFGPDKKFDLCVKLLESEALVKLAMGITLRKATIEFYDILNQERVEKYKAVIAALTRTKDVIEQDPLLCIV